MWKLKVADGEGPWLFSTNNFIGRQYWEFDPEYGTPEERAQVEKAREEYSKNRHQVKPSSDLLKQFQLIRENQIDMNVARVNLGDGEEVTYEVLVNALTKATRFTSALQAQDGHWPAENTGSLIFMPPLLMALHITGAFDSVLSSEHKKEVLRYIYNHQNEDGGWGSHVEGCSTMMGTVLNYISLRLLGETYEERAIYRAQNWILDHGGATMIPSWGKIHLSMLGVYEWSGCNPVPPEFWLLPSCLPINPGKIWCYCRTVYAPISYLYGKRFVGRLTDLVLSLRKELYLQPYDTIDWNKTRNLCAKEDLYVPHSLMQNLLWDSLYHIVEPFRKIWPLSRIRERALQKAMMLIHYEDTNTRYITQGCIEKAFQIVACWAEDSNSDAFKFHLARLPDYLWLAEDGMKVQTFGSQLWDSVLTVQAIVASDNADEYGPTLRKAHDFIKQSQLQEDPTGDFKSMYRCSCKGAWTFSDQDHGWQASDCTAEALSTLLMLSKMQPEIVGETVASERLYDAVDFLLSLQSKNGGFSAWEPVVGQPWLELFNPTDFLSDVMVEHEYVECTATVIHAFMLFKNLHREYKKKEIETSVAKALCYLKDTQRPDGSWYGFWGICFIYATWHALRGLAAGGETILNSMTVRKACRFLLSKQLESGGWGESYLSCPSMEYVPLEGKRANVVQTSWAMMGLIYARQGEIDPTPIHQAAKFLINSQKETGEFPQEEMTGCYMKNAVLHYAAYRSIFPLWALGEYRKHVPLPCKEI